MVDGTGCLLTPGLVNTHQHLYQWATRGLAVDATLFEWLTALYPVWAGIDEEVVRAASAAALAWLARTGCTTSTDHHYVFPRGRRRPAGRRGRRGRRGRACGSTRPAARWTSAPARAGCRRTRVVEDLDAILAATEAAITRFHDPASDSMLRVAVAPCSPFSVTGELMTEAAALARRHGVRLHTHLAETDDEESFCRERFGCTPTEYVDSLGWLGDDVWMAHAVHLDDAAVARFAATGTGVAHCPSSNARLGAGIARTRDLLDAGVPVGLGVDGAASNEAGSLLEELRARGAVRPGPRRPAPRCRCATALRLATLRRRAVLGRGGRDRLARGRQAGRPRAVADRHAAARRHRRPGRRPGAGTPPPLELLLVDGRPVVEHDRLVTVDEDELAREAAAVPAPAGLDR